MCLHLYLDPTELHSVFEGNCYKNRLVIMNESPVFVQDLGLVGHSVVHHVAELVGMSYHGTNHYPVHPDLRDT